MTQTRGQALSCIDALVDEARTGHGGGLLVRGEPGIGKTSLLRQGRDRATGLRIIAITGSETEVELTYSGLAGLIHALRAEHEGLSTHERAVLESSLGLAPPVPAEPLALGSVLLALMSAAAERSPLLLVADDLQFLDAGSCAALAFVLRRIANDPIAVVGAARDSSAITGASLGFEEITLGGLSDAEVGEAARGACPYPLTARVAAEIARVTGGNPLAVAEVARHLSAAQAAGATPLPGPPAVGARLVEVFSQEYLALTPGARRAARAVAAMGAADAAGLATGLGDDASGLAEAVESGVLAREDGRFQIRHPLVRTAILAVAGADELRQAHADVATIVQGARRTWHAALAVDGVDEARADALDETAQDAADRGDRSAAAAAWMCAADITPDPETRARRLFAASQMIAGVSGDPREILDRIAELTADPELVADTRILTAMVMSWSGEAMAVPGFIAEHEPAIRAVDPLRVDVLRGVEFSVIWQVGGRFDPEELRAQQPRIPPSGYHGEGVLAYVRHASALLVCGLADEARAVLGTTLAQSQDTNPMSIGPVTILASCCGLTDAAEARIDLALRAARRAGNGTAAAWLQLSAAVARLQRGFLTDARRAALESYELASEGAGPLALSQAAVSAMIACAHLGDDATGAALAADPRTLPVPSAVAVLAHADAIRTWVRGDPAAAFARLEPVAGLVVQLGNLASLHGAFLTDLAELAITTDHEQADALAEQAGRLIVIPGLQPGVRRLDLLRAAPEALDAAFAATQAAHRDARDGDFAQARTDLVHGQRLRAAGRDRDARVALTRAVERFAAAQAEPWQAIAAAELDGPGGAVSSVGSQGGAPLTPAEERVAQIVAEGSTTREAASLLFLSPKTVEMHLSRIYRKLGIRNRTELAVLYVSTTNRAT